jgi:hypothetical protein
VRRVGRKVGGPVSRIRCDEWGGGGAAAAAVDTGRLFSMLEMNRGSPPWINNNYKKKNNNYKKKKEFGW